MIKLETHCHSLGSSACGTTAPEIIAEEYAKAGYGGIVLTNHYAKAYFTEYPGAGKKEKLDYYFSLGEKMKECCENNGLKFFLGAEIKTVVSGEGYSEYILLGFDKNFFYDNPPLYELTQRELFRLANEAGVFMYQSHPFRTGVQLGEAEFMHGAEAFNGHFHHENNNALARKFCHENNLVQMSGTDYHHFGQPVTGGALVPESISDEKTLARYFMRGAQLIEEHDKYLKAYLEYKGL